MLTLQICWKFILSSPLTREAENYETEYTPYKYMHINISKLFIGLINDKGAIDIQSKNLILVLQIILVTQYMI